MSERAYWAIKFPSQISVECLCSYSALRYEFHLHFDGQDGSRLTVILSESQAASLTGLQGSDPQKLARDLYVDGHIELDELEQRLDRIGSA